jgi:phytoene dehydrogenase-like protein
LPYNKAQKFSLGLSPFLFLKRDPGRSESFTEDKMAVTKTVAIIGGGLAGLTAATHLARAGVPVTVFEKARQVGGRALTEKRGGFYFNLGPHALYARGAAARTFRALGLQISGRRPPITGGFALEGGAKHTLPAGFVSMLTTGALSLAVKWEAMRLLSTVAKLDAQALQRVSVKEWLEQTLQYPQTRRLIAAFLRVTTYAHDPERMSAGAAIAQFQLGLASGVLYLDDGWQPLVDQLHQAAEQAGARFVTSARVVKVEHAGAVQAVQLADGTRRGRNVASIGTGGGACQSRVSGCGAGTPA